MKEALLITILTVLGVALGFYLKEVSTEETIKYALPPAFPCHGENCYDSYEYETTPIEAFRHCQAALNYQMSE